METAVLSHSRTLDFFILFIGIPRMRCQEVDRERENEAEKVRMTRDLPDTEIVNFGTIRLALGLSSVFELQRKEKKTTEIN